MRNRAKSAKAPDRPGEEARRGDRAVDKGLHGDEFADGDFGVNGGYGPGDGGAEGSAGGLRAGDAEQEGGGEPAIDRGDGFICDLAVGDVDGGLHGLREGAVAHIGDDADYAHADATIEDGLVDRRAACKPHLGGALAKQGDRRRVGGVRRGDVAAGEQ